MAQRTAIAVVLRGAAHPAATMINAQPPAGPGNPWLPAAVIGGTAIELYLECGIRSGPHRPRTPSTGLINSATRYG